VTNQAREEWGWRLVTGVITGVAVLLVTLFISENHDAKMGQRELDIRKIAREEAVAVTSASVGEIKATLDGMNKQLGNLVLEVRDLRNRGN